VTFVPLYLSVIQLDIIEDANGLVIGESLFETVKRLDEYVFVPSSERFIGVKSEYGVYHVEQKEKRRSMINPFERRAA
jgi:hypothetical protein